MNSIRTIRKPSPDDEDLNAEIDLEARSNDERKTRQCLMCGRPFQSEGAGERICRSCKSTTAWRTG